MPIAPRPARWLPIAMAMAIALMLGSANAQVAAPRQVPEDLKFANGLYQNRQYDLAADEYIRFLKAGKSATGADLADAWYGLGNARVFLGQYKEAKQAFEGFLKVAPDHPNAPTARYRVGESAYMLGDLPEARRSLEAYASSNAGDRRYAPRSWLTLGDIAAKANDLPAARRAYESVLAINPQGSIADRAGLGLGQVLAGQGETAKALEVLRDLAAKGGPESVDKAWYQVGRIEATAGRWPEALLAFEAMEKAAPRGPLVIDGRIERAEALARLDRRDEAEALLRPIAADPAQPRGPQAVESLGTILIASGKPAEALKVFDDGLDRFPTASLLRYRSAEAALASGKPDDARARFLKIVEDDPKAPWADDALFRAAAIALDSKDNAQARTLATSFADRFPASPLKADAHLIEARAALASSDAKAAIQVLTASLLDDKPSPAVAQTAYYYLGLAYQKDGQAAKADEAFGMLAKGPGGATPEARFLIGQADFEAGRFAQAIPSLEAYLAEKPDGDVAADALARLAQAQAATDHLADAESTLARLVARFPKNPSLSPTRLKLAEAAFAARQFDRSADLFRLAAADAPPPIRARASLGLAWSLLQSGQPEPAAEAFAAFVDSSPDDPLAPEALAARARAFEDAKQPEKSLAALALVAEKYPQSPQAGPSLLALARLHVESKQPDLAAQTFARVAADYPKSAGETLDAVLAEWAWTLLEAGKTPEADTLFERILAEFPDAPSAIEARCNLAESAFAAKDYDRVLTMLTPVVAPGTSAKPASVESSLYRLGRTQTERREWPLAAATFDRLLLEFPEGKYRPQARFWKAEVAFKSGDPKTAETEFAAMALETEPKTLVATAKSRRIQCLVQLERWAEALTLADAFKLDHPTDPALPEVEFARGRCLQSQAKFDDARAAFDYAIEARKGSELAARAQLMRGETYFHQQEYRPALREFYRVVIQYNAPEWQALALLEAGKVHEKLDQWKDAAETYEKLRERFPKDRNVEEAIRRLEAARRRVASPAGADDARIR